VGWKSGIVGQATSIAANTSIGLFSGMPMNGRQDKPFLTSAARYA
jgi:hypothetical protein